MIELEFSIDLAKECGKIIKENFKGSFSVELKGDNNLVTNIDKAIDGLVRERIKKAFPSYGIVTEEGEDIEGRSSKVFVIDPLDGTTNFVKGYPLVAVSIALLEGNEVILGVVYNPILEEFYYATAETSSYKNGNIISVSKTDTLKNSLLSTGFPYDFSEYSNFPQFEKLFRRSISVRVDGSAALDLAHVAEGIIDGYWEKGLNIWDIAGGSIIVRQSSGTVSDFLGESNYLSKGEIVATNGKIHSEILEVLSDF
jgi:myo-inositol-1(or 4)-monophosphatase